MTPKPAPTGSLLERAAGVWESPCPLQQTILLGARELSEDNLPKRQHVTQSRLGTCPAGRVTQEDSTAANTQQTGAPTWL